MKNKHRHSETSEKNEPFWSLAAFRTSLRTRLAVVLVGIFLLPLFPMAWIVHNLVQHSYRVGVNPRVEQALQRSIAFSRELYQLRKKLLVDVLREQAATIDGQPVLPADDAYWQYKALQIFDRQGRLLVQASREKDLPPLLSRSQVNAALSKDGDGLLIARREKNHFVAAIKHPSRKGIVLALAAALPASFLQDTQQNLQVYQMYRALALQPGSIPNSILYTFLLFSLLILSLALAGAMWFSNRLTRPLDQLVQASREWGKGNLQYRVPVEGKDELAQLSALFNQMAERLKASQERAIYLEKMAAWQEMARRLAHEIKNPLTPIQLTVQEMVDRYQGQDKQYGQLLRECAAIIHEEVENLRRLVREFSEFGRLPRPQKRPGDLVRLVREMCALFPDRKFDLQLPEQFPQICMDEDHMRRVLLNLVQNAIQADPHNHPISIQLWQENGEIWLRIRDRGKGIPQELGERIFEPYVSTRQEGMGLGLAITRKIVEEHGGKICLEPVTGPGASFLIRLPLETQAREEQNREPC